MPPRPKPRLPLSAFASTPAPAQRSRPAEVIDASVTLGPAPTPDASQTPSRDLVSFGSITSTALGGPTQHRGVLWVQQRHDDWDEAVGEVDYICNTAGGAQGLVLGLIVQVRATLYHTVLASVVLDGHGCSKTPIEQGPDAVAAHLAKLYALPSLLSLALSHTSLSANSVTPATDAATPSPIKGVHVDLQASGTSPLRNPTFIESLRYLGTKALVANIAVENAAALDDVLHCIEAVRAEQPWDGPRTVFVIDHLGRPDLAGGRPALAAWTDRIFELSLVPDVYLKLNGLAAQADSDTVAKAFGEYNEHGARYSASSSALVALKRNVKLFLEPALDSFGVGRLIAGSGWPDVPGPDHTPAAAYAFALDLAIVALSELGVANDDLDAVFAGNARRVYGL